MLGRCPSVPASGLALGQMQDCMAAVRGFDAVTDPLAGLEDPVVFLRGGLCRYRLAASFLGGTFGETGSVGSVRCV